MRRFFLFLLLFLSFFSLASAIPTVNLVTPSNGSTIYEMPVGFNVFGTATGGEYIENISLWYSLDGGSWERNTTKYQPDEVYDEFNDASIDTGLWDVTLSGSYRSASESGGQISAKIDNSACSGVCNPGIAEINSSNLLTTAQTLKTNMTMRAILSRGSSNDVTGFLKVYGKIIKTAPASSSDDSIWTIEYINESYFKVYDDGVYSTFIIPTDNRISMRVYGVPPYEENPPGDTVNVNLDYVRFSNSTSINQTFLSYFPQGSSTLLWNMEFCDTSGICDFSSNNYTFDFDNDPPTFNIQNPVGLLNYSANGHNEEFNFSVTDNNLDQCWYGYGGVNYTIPSCSSDTFNSGNITLSNSLRSMIFYANDSLGNINSTTNLWDYKVFQDNLTFQPSVIEGSLETFNLYLDFYSGYSLSSAIFVYNGSSYSTSINAISGFANISSTIQIPDFVSDSNISFYFNLTLSDGTIITTFSENQTVSNIDLDNCTSYSNNIFNISLFDERTLSDINGTIEFNIDLLNSESNFISSASFYEGDAHESSICSNIDLTSSDYLYDLEIKYFSSSDNGSTYDYTPELYYIQKAEANNLPQTINLYDLNQNESTKFLVKYQNNNLVAVEGAVIQLLRKYVSEGVYRTVEAPLTSNIGTAVVHVDLNSNLYKAIVVKDGVVLDTFDNLVFNCESELTGLCTQNLFGTIDPQNSVSVENLNDFSYTITEVNNTLTVTFTIPSSTASTVNFYMTQTDNFGSSTACNQTIFSSAGSLQCSYNESLSDSILELQIRKDGVLIAQKSYFIAEANSVDWLGNNYFIVFIFLLSLVGMAMASPEWIVVMGLLTFVLAGGIWLLNGLSFVVGLEGLIWLIIVVIILIIKLSGQEDR